MPDDDVPREPEHLVLYDGACGFCSHVVGWLLDADRHGLFHFAPLQGSSAAALRGRHPDLPADPNSVLYVDRSSGSEQVFARAQAIFRICDRLDHPPIWLGLARRLPAWLTDFGYRAVARTRHRLSRALAPCPLPSSAARARFHP